MRACAHAAARKLIAQSGVDALTLSAVARACAITRNDLFGLFRNKTELLLAIAADDLAGAGRALSSRTSLPVQTMPYASLVTSLTVSPADTIVPPPGPLPGPVAGLPLLPEDGSEVPPVVVAHRRSDSVQLNQIIDRLGVPTTALGEGSATAVARVDRRVIVLEKILTELQTRFDKLEKVANDGLQTTGTSLEGLVQRADHTEKKLAETAKTLRGELLEAFTHVVPPPAHPPRVTPPPQDPAVHTDSETAATTDMPPETSFDTPPASPSDALMRAAFKRAGSGDDYLAHARRSANEAAEAVEPPPAVPPQLKPRARRRKHLLNREQLMGIGAISIAVILATMGIALSEGLLSPKGITPAVTKPIAPPLPALASVAPDTPQVPTQPPAPQEAAPTHPVSTGAAPKLTPEQRLEILVNGGNTKAALIAGVRYLDGDGVLRNEAQAATLLERAAKAGEPIAQYRLGTLFQRGAGVLRDEAQALRWYEAAANQGNRKAMHNLGVFYAEGRGTAQNFEHAAAWFLRAANLGYVDSQFDMGVLYERGAGVPQNLGEAYKWYSIAAKAGDAVSKTRVEVLSSQLDAQALTTARAAAIAFHPAPLGRVANVMPQLSDLHAR